jgi:hypothetical protein
MRALAGATKADDLMTLEMCADFCTGFTYFGTEYARECYCGNSFNAGSVPAPGTECNFPCANNPLEYCGAGNRLSVYSSDGSSQPSQSSSTATGPPTSTSSVPVPTDMPDGWTYQGCWIDGAHGRVFDHQIPDSNANSQEACAHACKDAGYSISGAEYGVQCFCGNYLVNGAVKTTDAACNMACPGVPTEKCGAGDRLSVFSGVGVPTVYAPATPQTTGLDGDWTYVGCVQDNVGNKRTFSWQLMFLGTMTPNMCLNQCASFGYAAAGLEYGHECYCGDPENVNTHNAQYVSEAQCGTPCEGLPSAYCGGLAVMTTYFWTGTPLYKWDFPTGPAAGEYQFLIGGVTVPLMTMQSITGKVTFLSKSGTGPGNETGAYELDLTVLDNFNLAWREMHLQTDVFCSAGVILPDKAGRQLNVGGWSGWSTYGTRLYWPDGSNGVWGTHDWQENVDELSLQKGRWYPSAMIMANGSIMVIGGEIGANDIATPSIEVLPSTGTAPLYMEWLDRTNPNNLYPFICVLPGGGIFVGYWNEARILNEVTFETVKTLPNMPGAVNDPLGGRTYPLAGAMVLLPQVAPYTDPLGMLVCGGSTIGTGNALDNCVSTYPEAADPEWIIERMPSVRVMPCIAPLPDGTYLIANGAVHGVAGFGLANDPNLNAILYDPFKPVHHRFSVLANTTVARLYHSEAITLLDGRVLISGSDPTGGQPGVMPEEYRVEVFVPPYLLTGKPRPSFTINNKDWTYSQTGISFTLGALPQNGDIKVSLLGAVSSTHGNSMGARTLIPAFSCNGVNCLIDAPPGPYICPPGWYQLHVLDGGVPAVGTYVRIGGDPAALGNWPPGDDFLRPGI